jgi:tetratricopeptide (TPR) repeat protein
MQGRIHMNPNRPSQLKLLDNHRRDLCDRTHSARKVVFTIFFWLLSSPWMLAQSGQSGEIRSHYERAQSDLQANRPGDAVLEFQAILRLDPNNAEAHANLGLIAFAGANYDAAARELRAALKIHPSLWNAQAFLGMSEMHLGTSDEARQPLETAFAHLEDKNLRIRVGTMLIQLDYEQGKLDDALNVATVLNKLAPDDPDVLYIVYRTHSALAARALSTLAKVGPNSARLHEVLAESHASDNDFSGAIAEYEKALAIDSTLPGVHFELGEAILRNKSDEDSRARAEQQFAAALVENPYDAHSEYELGEIAFRRSRWQEAMQHYARAAQLQPALVDAQVALGKILTQLGQPEAAIKPLLEAVRLDPDNASAHYRLAQVYRALKRDDDARREMETFLALHKAEDVNGTKRAEQ